VVKKVPCQAQCDYSGASAIFRGLVTPRLLLVLRIKIVLKGQRFASAEEVTAKAKSALTRYRETVSRNASESFMDVGKSMSLPKGTILKEMLCKWL
jgi:hypothetical protein